MLGGSAARAAVGSPKRTPLIAHERATIPRNEAGKPPRSELRAQRLERLEELLGVLHLGMVQQLELRVGDELAERGSHLALAVPREAERALDQHLRIECAAWPELEPCEQLRMPPGGVARHLDQA